MDSLAVWNGTLSLTVMYRWDVDGRLLATFDAQNTGRSVLRGTTYALGCFVEMRAYASSDRSGQPVWQDEHEGRSCRDMGWDINLPPGATARIGRERVVTTREVLPADTAYFSARVVMVDPALRTREFPAGQVPSR